jgi:hypothetical protein
VNLAQRVLAFLRKPIGARASAAQVASTDSGGASETLKSLWLRALTALFATLGVAGSVTLVGSILVWERFDAAELPATQALDVVPESQLLIEGASALVVGLVLGLVVVLLVYAFNPEGTATWGSALALALAWVGGLLFAVGTRIGAGAVVLVSLFGLILIVAALGVGSGSGQRFLPFATAVFFAAIAYSGALNFAIAEQEKFAQPVAALKEAGGNGLHGLYVADTDDYIYIGLVRDEYPTADEDDPIPIYRLPRVEDTRFLVGDARPRQAAIDYSRELLEALRAMPRAQVAREENQE